jgi:EAL and modified HD-GYP domain-containing signal transduction protein
MDESIQELQQSAPSSSNRLILVSRRPIYARSVELFAYELGYDTAAIEEVVRLHGETAAAEVFTDTFSEEGLEPFVGESAAFIGIPSFVILRGFWRALPKQKVVLELQRDFEFDESALSELRAMKESGYRIALSDGDYSEENRALGELADYISIDFQRRNRQEIADLVVKLKPSHAKMIASNLEMHQGFEAAMAMGFDYYRGACFNKPKLTTPPRVPINRLSTLQLTLKLQEPNLSTVDLEKFVSQDLAISYKLLHYVNSAALSLSRTIESIRHAIQLVGTERIRAWASMLLLSKLDDKPAELLITAFVRAQMAERLAAAQGAANPDSFYMVGLFSEVDTLLNVPMSEAIQLLPFTKPVREALLHHDGPMGDTLKCVLAYENGRWDEVGMGNLPAATIRECYLDALAAARKLPKLTVRDRQELKNPPAKKF